MRISSDEARALAFIAALIGLTFLGRWVDRPRPVGIGEPEVDIAAVAARSEAKIRGANSGSGTGSRTESAAEPGLGEPISLNGASSVELERLPGVGPALAGRIVAYRDSVGRFGAVEELDSVKGIGPAMLARLKPLVRL